MIKLQRYAVGYATIKNKEAIEAVCELNHELLRAERDTSKAEGKKKP